MDSLMNQFVSFYEGQDESQFFSCDFGIRATPSEARMAKIT